jgi:hypothetical protein
MLLAGEPLEVGCDCALVEDCACGTSWLRREVERPQRFVGEASADAQAPTLGDVVGQASQQVGRGGVTVVNGVQEAE